MPELIGLHSFTTENKLKRHENVCKNHDYCYIEMPEEDKKVLKYNHVKNYMKVTFISYANIESRKTETCQ